MGIMRICLLSKDARCLPNVLNKIEQDYKLYCNFSGNLKKQYIYLLKKENWMPDKKYDIHKELEM